MKVYVIVKANYADLEGRFERNVSPATVENAGKVLAQLTADVTKKLGDSWAVQAAGTMP